MNRSDCPSPEELAAFLDGRLSEDARRELVAHLDGCPDCYEVFSESARFLQEDAPRGKVLRPAGRFGGRRMAWAVGSMAASLLLLVLASFLWTGGWLAPSGQVLLATSDLAGAMAHPASAAQAIRAGGLGPLGFSGQLSPTQRSFRSGVRLLDLQVAIDAGDRQAAEDALDGLENLGVEVASARRVARSGFLWAMDLRRSARALEQDSEKQLDPSVLALGKWTEAGRLAAKRGDHELFARPVFREFRRSIDPASLPTNAARRALAGIDALTPTGGTQAGDLAKLGNAFEDLEAAY